ncbi:MAG: prenyltransferase/squalene oxidase repeat-containing protein [Planctomycetota bacterium]
MATILSSLFAGPDLRAQDELRPALIDDEIQGAIDRGLSYLVRAQNRDGSWRYAGGHGSYPIAMTALAGMALLGNGSTPTRGRYQREVQRAKDFLLRSVDEEGLISTPTEERRSMYGHGFATMFLAQVYGMEEDPVERERIRLTLEGAVELIDRAQSAEGGWLYRPDSVGDEGSVTITQVQALRACRDAGITVPRQVIDDALAYIEKSANPDGGIRYSYGSPGAGRPAITAAAVCVFYNSGVYENDLAERAYEFATSRVGKFVVRGDHPFYTHLYLSQAHYQRGPEDFDPYYQSTSEALLRLQASDGSWSDPGGGETYGTAVALTILQLPLARVPIYQR